MTDFISIKNRIDRICQKKGLSDYKMVFSESSSVSATASARAIRDTQTSTSSLLSFTASVGSKGGSSLTSTYDASSLEHLVSDAMDNASCIESMSQCFIFEGSKQYEGLEDKPFRLCSTESLAAKALSLQNQMEDSDSRVQSGSETVAGSEMGRICIANSKGLVLQRQYGYSLFMMNAIVSENDESKSAMDFGVCDLSDMKMDRCVSDALAKLHGSEASGGKCSIVLSSYCMRQMLNAFASVLFGKSATLGLSLFKGKEGSKVASDLVTLVDDPFESSSPVRIQFDADGVANETKKIIDHGVLDTLLYSLSSASEAGKQGTGNAGPYLGASETSFFSLYLEKGSSTLDELLLKAGNGGIYVEEMKGLHAGANASTGDYSIECAGFAIKDGKKDRPLKSFTISGSFYDLLKSIEGVSDDLQWGLPSGFRRIGSPEVLVSDVSVSI